MQRFSFDFNDPMFDLQGFKVGVQLHTFENTYGLDPDRSHVVREEGVCTLVADGLTWAGGQERSEGFATVRCREVEGEFEFRLRGQHHQVIRCIKLLLFDLPGTRVCTAGSEALEIPADGLLLTYPYGDGRGLTVRFPVALLDDGAGKFISFRCQDARVRPKRLAFLPNHEATRVELVFEEEGTEFARSISTCPWLVGRGLDPEEVVARQMRWMEQAWQLQPWDERPDVPDWLRPVSLCASLHGMHWTGYIFNTYADMVQALEWICDRIWGENVLAYLPGWEGRYYWQYGEYRPEPRLGGAEGFRKLVEGAHKMGVRVMPMFGANCANALLPDYPRFGKNAHLHSASGLVFHGNRPDWSGDRSHDPGWQAWLNPGAPAWQNWLYGQIMSIVDEYDCDAVFLDTIHVWQNDPYHNVHDGIQKLVRRLREGRPELLVAFEAAYDALMPLSPLVQHGPPAVWPELFATYMKGTGHLSFPAPGSGSTGVHERGLRPFYLPELRREVLPTLTLVDNTLRDAPQQAEEVIALARAYAARFGG